MDKIALSKRYAEAIYEVATKNNEVFDVLEMLYVILEHINHDEDFRKFLSYPEILKEDKQKLIAKIYEDIGKEPLEILEYLIEKEKLLYINEIYNEYSKIYYREHNKIIVSAIFPKELSDEQKEKLEKKIKKMKSKDVIIYYKIDKELIGGGIVKINDDIYDGSISSQINKLRNNL